MASDRPNREHRPDLLTLPPSEDVTDEKPGRRGRPVLDNFDGDQSGMTAAQRLQRQPEIAATDVATLGQHRDRAGYAFCRNDQGPPPRIGNGQTEQMPRRIDDCPAFDCRREQELQSNIRFDPATARAGRGWTGPDDAKGGCRAIRLADWD